MRSRQASDIIFICFSTECLFYMTRLKNKHKLYNAFLPALSSIIKNNTVIKRTQFSCNYN